VDQVFRYKVVLTPSEVAEKYMAALGPKMNTNQEEMSLSERTKFVRKKCNRTKTVTGNEGNDNYFYLKSQNDNVKNVLLCIPPRMASKSTFDALNEVFDFPCYKGSKGKLRDCSVSESFQPGNKTVKIVFTRHPFDRLIIEFRHQKEKTVDIEDKPAKSNRKLLFSRHRSGLKKKGGKGSHHHFREFIKTTVLGDNSSVMPVSQVCQVCNQNYDLIYNLDDGLEHLNEVLKITGSDKKHRAATGSKAKVVGPKVQQTKWNFCTTSLKMISYCSDTV